MSFCSTLKVRLYAKEKWQERDLWQHQQGKSSNSIIKGGGNLSEVNHMQMTMKSKGAESLSSH